MTNTPLNTSAPTYFGGFKRFHGFTGNQLKLLAMAVMLIDHLAYAWQLYNVSYPVYLRMRIIGRIAFPIFAYMIAVGAQHTHDIKKYLLRLFAFALLSEIPFDLAFNGMSIERYASSVSIGLEFESQNVFFTLFLGLLTLAFLRLFRKKLGRWYMIPSVAVLLLMMAAAYCLKTDYAEAGVLSIFLFYVASDKKTAVKLPLFALAITVLVFDANSLYNALQTGDWSRTVNTVELYALYALFLIPFHNGQRGAKMNKWIFYAFYPCHLFLLYLLRMLLKL